MSHLSCLQKKEYKRRERYNKQPRPTVFVSTNTTLTCTETLPNQIKHPDDTLKPLFSSATKRKRSR